MESPTSTITLATFNIRHGQRGERRRVHARHIRAAVRQLQADILGIQEVDRAMTRTHRLDEPALLVHAAAAQDSHFAVATRFGSGEYGNVLATRGELADPETVELPGIPGEEPRVAAIATVTVSGVELCVAVTHLDPGPDGPRQLAHLCDHLAGETLPTVVMGDLNLTLADVVPILAPAGFTIAGGLPSYPRTAPRYRIDHIAVRGLVLGDVVVPELPLSDHRPVIVEVTVPR